MIVSLRRDEQARWESYFQHHDQGKSSHWAYSGHTSPCRNQECCNQKNAGNWQTNKCLPNAARLRRRRGTVFICLNIAWTSCSKQIGGWVWKYFWSWWCEDMGMVWEKKSETTFVEISVPYQACVASFRPLSLICCDRKVYPRRFDTLPNSLHTKKKKRVWEQVNLTPWQQGLCF